MFSKFIQWVDSLFYTTTVTTTITKSRIYHGEAAIKRRQQIYKNTPLETMDDQVSTPISREDDVFIVNGKKIKIPQSVATRRPLFTKDGLDYDTYPWYESAPFSVSYISSDKKFAAYDGTPLGRNRTHDRPSKKTVIDRHALYKQASDSDSYLRKAEATIGDDVVVFTLAKEWAHVSITRKDGSVIQISQDNVRQFDFESECITFAYGYARIVLLTLDTVGQDFTQYDEEDLATILLALFISDRV